MKMDGNKTGKSFGSGAHRQCSAKSKRSGERCRAPAVKGRLQCRMHGGILSSEYHGAAVDGPSNPNWKHGRYSKETFRKEAAERDKRSESTKMVDDYLEALRGFNEINRAAGLGPIRPRLQRFKRRVGYDGDRPQCHGQKRDLRGRFC